MRVLKIHSITLGLTVASVMFASPALAQSRGATATGALQVERALTLSNVQSMSFVATRRNVDEAGAPNGTAADPTGDASDAPAVIDITGDPGRVYRIQLPATIDTDLSAGVISGFQVWSETVGDVSKTMTGRLNAEGHDRLRISGVLTTAHGMLITDVQTAVPVNIDYE
jgi:hypothetical protein